MRKCNFLSLGVKERILFQGREFDARELSVQGLLLVGHGVGRTSAFSGVPGLLEEHLRIVEDTHWPSQIIGCVAGF